MKPLKSLMISGREVLPLIEGGKGISISNGESSGAWAAAGGVGTFSGVNADSYDKDGKLIPQIYRGKTRQARHEELIAYAIQGGITQATKAYDGSNGMGRIHMNILWEMAAAERILLGVLEGAKGLINGVTCGAGMPYKIAEIAAKYGIYYYPIVSSARAFRALWLRAYHKFRDMLGAVVYEDPWLAGGHNGLSNSEDPKKPEDPYPRILALRQMMREWGLGEVPIVMAGGVWWLSEWEDWLDNPELGPIAFQFGTRPLLTAESPISNAWKKRLLTLQAGDVYLNRFSPTGFYSSAVRNPFLQELHERSERQVAYTVEQIGEHTEPLQISAVGKPVYLTAGDLAHAKGWMKQGFSKPVRTPDSTLIFVTLERAQEILADQIACMGCLSACQFSNWSQNEAGTTGRKPDPRSFCIQKTLQNISHDGDVEKQLMFAGHNAYRFGQDPWYQDGFVPTVRQLVERIQTGFLSPFIDFLSAAIRAAKGAIKFALMAVTRIDKEAIMPFELKPLPYDKNALAPYMSDKTLDFHHGKHHKTYVETLNKLIAGTKLEKATLEDIIEETSEDEKQKTIFNNAAQVWNHDFFWSSMKPGGGGAPKGDFAKQIDTGFGGFDGFKKKFTEAATTQFGSGWAWLVLDNNKLSVIKTGNAVNPLIAGQKALLTCDVWEHAYYLDYQNRRADMVDAYLDHLINWDFAAKNLAA